MKYKDSQTSVVIIQFLLIMKAANFLKNRASHFVMFSLTKHLKRIVAITVVLQKPPAFFLSPCQYLGGCLSKQVASGLCLLEGASATTSDTFFHFLEHRLLLFPPG